MGNIKTNYIVKTAIIAALYAAVTILLAPISYGPIQFRVSEVMVLLVFIDRKYLTGLVLGCFFANMLSQAGIYDMVFGTLATLIALLGIVAIRKIFGDNLRSLFIASLSPVIVNGLIIGWMLSYLYQLPLMLTAFQVGIGEFGVVSILGVVLIKYILNNNKILELIKIDD
ncbi:QueT transporter family protein [Clostridiaceae bacterium HSG29]|nr:QueT transporter family protein [Clostridiaceae bacterium HSG29]